ncbi:MULTISPECIES: hypothetical protein [Pseudoalteromonas]|uniref:Orphan protein n=1 Tax=Pseudoalteromonas aurantia 208 TaxID=1314867 RepID=A0ABR9E950_9GAMM|nr:MULTISPECIES: hypothetical protein [Pseudoalteromonas]MBE0367327.1 hypothetical protein [Pseudoalteromonas aurantia 208]MBQ4846257.1 hypothetical protein [Pseudoalteromonas sp. MMG005]
MNTFTKLTAAALLLSTSISAQANSITLDLYSEVSEQITSIISTQIEEAKSATLRSVTDALNSELKKQNNNLNTAPINKEEDND